MIYGDAGSRPPLRRDGNDLINAGAGDDTVCRRRRRRHLIVAASGDGNDIYFGDDSSAAPASTRSTCRRSTANVTVDLGTGFMVGRQRLQQQTGTDTLWGVENVVTGSGNDTITARSAVNIMDGGGGNDTFRFQSTAEPMATRSSASSLATSSTCRHRRQQRDRRQPVVHAGDRRRLHRRRPAAGHPRDARGRRIHRRRGQYVRRRHGRVPR